MSLEVVRFRGATELSGEGYLSVVPVAFDLILTEDADPRFMEQAGRAVTKGLMDRHKAMAEGRFEDIQHERWN